MTLDESIEALHPVREHPPDQTPAEQSGIEETEHATAQRSRSTQEQAAKPKASPVVLPIEPTQLTPRFSRETGAYQVSRLHWAYHTVSLDHPDAPALDILDHFPP